MYAQITSTPSYLVDGRQLPATNVINLIKRVKAESGDYEVLRGRVPDQFIEAAKKLST